MTTSASSHGRIRPAITPGLYRLDPVVLLQGADAGLAVFDGQYKLIACNELYRKLFAYDARETAAGVSIRDLIATSMRRINASPASIEVAIASAIERLRQGQSYSFRYATSNGRTVEVTRRVMPNGTVIETAREIAGTVSGVDNQIAHMADTARTMMLHALDVIADGFALYDQDDRLVVYNRRFVECKPSVADLIMPGMSFEQLVRAEAERNGVRLYDRSIEQYVAARTARHRSPGEPIEMHLQDGRWIQIHEKKTDEGYIVSLLLDITNMKERELDLLRISKQLHERSSQFDVALSNMIQGLCLFDSEQRLLVCNRRYLSMYGFSPDVVKPGIQLRDIMKYSVSLGNYTEEEGQRALAERPDPNRLNKRTTIKQHLRDGRVIAVMNEPLPEGGSIATYQDITELEQNQRRMREYTQKLERSNSELQEFAYVASHDLQEPLRKIEAFGDRLNRRYATLLPDEGRMFIERMQDAAGRMRRLINDLLSYSRVTSKTKPFAQVDLQKIFTEVLGDLQVRIDETGAEIRSENLPVIEADATQMRQLIQNLLSNALKFRKADVKPVIVVAGRLGDAIAAGPNMVPSVVITVADNGIGFDNMYKEQIFKIFQRLHGRLEYEGTGVGLATCRKIVERHLGTIDADGRPGVGATFSIVLPTKQPQPQQAAETPPSPTA
jgi:signal transduction histidine kinase